MRALLEYSPYQNCVYFNLKSGNGFEHRPNRDGWEPVAEADVDVLERFFKELDTLGELGILRESELDTDTYRQLLWMYCKVPAEGADTTTFSKIAGL